MATTLGTYTDEKYDSTLYHVRTILFDLNSSGNVESGNIIVFSSSDELSRDGFDTYLEQYLVKDFGDVEMTVSRYTTRFEAVDAFLYRSGQIPLEISTRFEKIQVSSSGKLGQLSKLDALTSITDSNTICYIWCHTSGVETCVGPYTGSTDTFCGTTYTTTCTTLYCSDLVSGGGGGGGGGDGTQGEGEGEDDCEYTDKICDLIEEYEDIGIADHRIPSANEFSSHASGRLFTWDELNGGWLGGTERGAHKPYGVFHTRFIDSIDDIREEYGQAIHLSSGYRCSQGNTNEGSRFPTTSYHMFGRAVDMTTGNSPVIFNELVRIKEQEASYLEHESMSTYPDGHLHLEYEW